MKIIDHPQGSTEWHAHRAKHRNAGDAAAMLGCSPHESRNALLKRVYLDMQKDVSDFVQAKVFDPGHLFERLARPIAEKIANDDLYPIVGVLEGTLLSASFDGAPLDESFSWEHKRLSDELRSAFTSITEGELPRSALPLHHRIQMEHQMIVLGSAERALFMASDWTESGDLVDEHHCWYDSDPELRQRVLDGWAQFENDLAAYELPAATPAAPVGTAPETLPALRIEVTGQVTASNLAEFKATALATIRSVNRELTTDQHFADAEKAVKWCADVESRLKAAKEHALSQTASIDALFKALDDISAEARTVRLDLDKLVARRKTEVKEEAVARARRALDQHIAALNGEIAPFHLPTVAADFAGCIKGLKSVASMQDKLDGLLATAKIAAEADARAIRANVATFKAAAEGFEFLFSDLGQIVHKAADDFAAIVLARIAQHREAEARREAERQAAEAARIAAAEQRAREEEARRIEQQRQAEEAARLAAEASARAAAAPAPAPVEPVNVAGPAHLAPQPAPGLAFDARGVLSPIPEPRADEPATLNLGAICGRLGFTVSAQFLADTLHVQPARTDKASRLYTERQFALICQQLVRHVGAMAELHTAEAA